MILATQGSLLGLKINKNYFLASNKIKLNKVKFHDRIKLNQSSCILVCSVFGIWSLLVHMVRQWFTILDLMHQIKWGSTTYTKNLEKNNYVYIYRLTWIIVKYHTSVSSHLGTNYLLVCTLLLVDQWKYKIFILIIEKKMLKKYKFKTKWQLILRF